MARRTPLNDAHRGLGARMVDFAGWDMPVQYTSVIAEHEAVRNAVGLFDVSHMGEIEFSGPGALESANRLISNDLSKCADGQALYAGLLNDTGGFVDDVVAYRFSPERILIVVNASNKDKDFAWMSARAEGVKPVDKSDDWAQIAVQGPILLDAAERLGVDPSVAIMAVSYGDQWTNMIQPFWALPLLAIAGLRIRDILGYTTMILITVGVVLSATLLLVGPGV